MKGLRSGEAQLFEAFIKSTQYLVRLQSQQDIWEHLGKFVLTHFPADWLAFVERDSGNGLSLGYCTLPESVTAQNLLTKEVRTLAADVLESGFLASRVLLNPAPSMTVFLPIVENYQTNRVMLIGHADAQPLPKELLGIYLALAGLAGTATERKRAEEEVRRLNADLERRVAERTVQLQTANNELRKENVERKRAEQALRESWEWLRVTLTSIGDAVMTADTQGRVTFLNPVAEALTGWKMEEALGQSSRSVFQIVNEQTRVPAEDIVAHVLEKGQTVELANHTALATKDGREVPVEDSAAPILDDDGRVIGVVLVFHDVTEKRRAQEALRESEEELRQKEAELREAQRIAHIGSWHWDTQTDVFTGSDELLCIYGLDPATQLMPDFRDQRGRLYPVESWERINAAVQQTLQTGAGYELDVEAIRADGSMIWVTTRGEAMRDAAGRIVGLRGTVQDITERKRTEQALVRSEKLASVGRLAATIAHEINNPLAAVMNTVFLARSEAEIPESARQYLEIADEELSRISHITRQALGFYRESSKPTTTSVSAVLDSVLYLLHRKIKDKRIAVEKRCAEGTQVSAVAGELRQVLSNLLANSLDALDRAGTIKIRVSSSRSIHHGQSYVRVTVADNGSGIDDATLPRIFEPLFTTKEATGSGLGLWVSKQLIEKHGGSIRVHSSSRGPRRGTVFSIFLPAEGARAAPSSSSNIASTN
jgi:PAS domain S-box-containing protein